MCIWDRKRDGNIFDFMFQRVLFSLIKVLKRLKKGLREIIGWFEGRRKGRSGAKAVPQLWHYTMEHGTNWSETKLLSLLLENNSLPASWDCVFSVTRASKYQEKKDKTPLSFWKFICNCDLRLNSTSSERKIWRILEHILEFEVLRRLESKKPK